MRQLLFFHADYCTPCKRYDKELITPLEAIVGNEKVKRIDATQYPGIAKKYGVDKLPYAVLLDSGKAVYASHLRFDVDVTAKWLNGGESTLDD